MDKITLKPMTGVKPPWNLWYPIEGEPYLSTTLGSMTVSDILDYILLKPEYRFGHVFVYRWNAAPCGRLWFRRESIVTDQGVIALRSKEAHMLLADIGKDGRSDFYIKLKE